MNESRIVDKHGAVIFTDLLRNQYFEPVGYEIFIKPAGERHRRPLAKYVKDLDALIIERNGTASIHQRHGGYHVNRHILNDPPGGLTVANKLILLDIGTGNVYVMPLREFAREASPPLLQRTGLAEQVFMTFEWIEHFPCNVPYIINMVKMYASFEGKNSLT